VKPTLRRVTSDDALTTLQLRLARAIDHAVDLRTDLEALADDLAAVLPALLQDGPGRRREAVSTLLGVEERMPADLRRMTEQLGDVLALLGANDRPEEWLRRQLSNL